ncbi:hypothetical protein [Psychroflexus planctonicus]|uniref:Uncharacterized protein n=1 Tax=Psychroflexus planctonicus TaxID=1526575 RepID=A0ABQ1SI23_9FLAO|nr:hypothetical protein [Psychroflexus planctonicus]GGE36709.1 hypothetical protein GCM10010832_16110 [Psychroflexus planctonicus]
MKRNRTWQNHFFNFLSVILGVYLAFLINEKAQEKKERAEVNTFLQSIVTELKTDINTFEKYQIPQNEKFQNQLADLIPLFHKDSTQQLNKELFVILEIDNYVPTTAAYSSLKSSGKFNMIQNIHLLEKLSSYYENYAAETEAKSEYQIEFFSTYLLTWCMQNVDLESFEITNTDHLQLLKNYIIIYQSLLQQKTNSLYLLIEQAKALQEEIELEIN